MTLHSTSNASMVRHFTFKAGYRVGDDGSVWSCLKNAGGGRYVITDEWHRLKPGRNRRGYLSVHLGRRDQRSVHKMVLEAFVGPCPEGMECRHLDDDPGNCRLSNLCWGTKDENAADMVRHGRSCTGEKNRQSVMTDAAVIEAVAMHQDGKRTIDIATWFKVHPETIRKIFRGRTWRHVTRHAEPATVAASN